MGFFLPFVVMEPDKFAKGMEKLVDLRNHWCSSVVFRNARNWSRFRLTAVVQRY